MLLILIAVAFGLGFAAGAYIAVQIQHRKWLGQYKNNLAFTVKKNRELREQLREERLRVAIGTGALGRGT